MGRSIRNANRWLIQTPDRALDQAYDAALMIKSIEDQHFEGQKIPQKSRSHSDTVLTYFQNELKKNLKLAEVRLIEFRASRFIVDSTNSTLYNRSLSRDRDHSAAILEKLEFIDGVLSRYESETQKSKALVPATQVNPNYLSPRSNENSRNGTTEPKIEELMVSDDDNSILDKTGVLPRSILGTLTRIKRDLDPQAEEQVLRTFRNSKVKTLISIRLILLLIIVPLLVQQLSKSFIVGPLVDYFWKPRQTAVFLNYELEEEALREFNTFRERLEFEQLIGIAPSISPDNSEEKELILQAKAQEIAATYAGMGANAIKNIFADLFSAISFAIVLTTNREGLAILKSFIDETVYGLSDSAKAFIIILFTDIFVGFHSPHGWEILLEGFARHFGLPANRDFIFLFIATFPVILDTIFKYWIFRYLNRISPSAVATYKTMNET